MCFDFGECLSISHLICNLSHRCLFSFNPKLRSSVLEFGVCAAMGKSPGKWIKTLLFKKKTSGSGAAKGRDALKSKNGKDVWVPAKEPYAEAAMDHPAVPVASNASRNAEISELDNGLTSTVTTGGASLPINNDAANALNVGSDSSHALENAKREQAAIKAQAAFRGHLARRAFRTLKGIVRLQALIRGHLVRRQAVATLRCLRGIVKLQALVRARRVRCSDTGSKIRTICHQGKTLDAQVWSVNMALQSDKHFSNACVRKLLSTSPTGMPLLIKYSPDEPNSAWNWLERWTIIFVLKPIAQHKHGVIGSKGEIKQRTSHSVETEVGRSKSTVKGSTGDSGSAHPGSDFEKPKRNLKKIASHPVDTVQEHPQNELEKVKRNLRKVSNSTTDIPERLDVESEKPKRNVKKATALSSEVPDQQNVDSVEQKKDTATASADNLDVESSLKPLATDGLTDTLRDNHLSVELRPLEINGKDNNTNGEMNSKEDQSSHENHKSSRRRASLSAKTECSENGVQNTQTLPSYMAATESAKAKLRAQGSPRFSQDGPEKNGITRRHSLPSATSGKVSSPSVRGQRASGKGGAKSEKSSSASRDGNEKVGQTEWRR